jgi:hypothetical protein
LLYRVPHQMCFSPQTTFYLFQTDPIP